MSAELRAAAAEAAAPGQRRRRGLQALAAVAICLALSLFQVREALFAGGELALLSPDTATQHLPWSRALAESGALDGEVSRPRQPGLSDQGVNLYPTYSWVLRSYLRGDAPSWNPLLYTGAPNFGNPQSGALDPQVLAMLPLVQAFGERGFHVGLALAALFRLCAALLGAYALARLLGLGAPGALLAAIGFGCSGYLLAWRDAPLGHVTPFLPWVLWGVERCARPRPAVGAGVAALALALAIFGGHPETAFFAGAGAGALALAVGVQNWRAGALALGGLACGTLLASVPLLAFLDYLPNSGAMAVRAVAQRRIEFDGAGLALGGLLALGLWGLARRGRGEGGGVVRALPLALLRVALAAGLAALVLWIVFARGAAGPALQLAFVPDLFGKPGVGAGYGGSGSWPEASGAWLVLPVLALALAATLAPRLGLARGRTLAWVGWLSLAACVEFPGLVELQRLLPFIGLGDPGRLAVLSSLCLSLLAGAGLERVRGLERTLGAAVVAAAVALVAGRAALPSTFSDARLEAEARASDERLTRAGAGYLTRPGPSIEGTQTELEGWFSVADRAAFEGALLELREVTGDGAALERAPAFVLPVETSAAPRASLRAVAERRAPEGARYFRFNYLQANRLDAGVWRIDLRLADGSPPLLVRATEVHRPFGGSRAALWGLFAMLAAVVAAGRWPRLAWVVVAASAAQALWMAEGGHPAVPAAEAFPETETERVVAAHLGEHRFFSDPGVLPPDTGLMRDLRALDGYDALDPAGYARYRPLVMAPGAHALLSWNPRGVDLASPAFRLLGVNTLVLAGPIEAPGFELVAAPDGSGPARAECFIYVDRDPLPRAFVVPRAAAPVEVESALRAGVWDPLELAALPDPWTPATPLGSWSARTVERRNASLELEVELEGHGLLVVTDQFFPGWRATVDGAPTEILRANTNFLAVPLEPGRHRVEFRYRPTRQTLALALTALGALLLVTLLLLLRPRDINVPGTLML